MKCVEWHNPEKRCVKYLVRARFLDVYGLDHERLVGLVQTAALIARLPGVIGAGIEASVARAGRG